MLPNRSAGDVGCEIFSYLYQFAAVCLDTMGWQLRLGRMGELIKVEGAGKSLLFAIGAAFIQSIPSCAEKAGMANR